MYLRPPPTPQTDFEICSCLWGSAVCQTSDMQGSLQKQKRQYLAQMLVYRPCSSVSCRCDLLNVSFCWPKEKLSSCFQNTRKRACTSCYVVWPIYCICGALYEMAVLGKGGLFKQNAPCICPRLHTLLNGWRLNTYEQVLGFYCFQLHLYHPRHPITAVLWYVLVFALKQQLELATMTHRFLSNWLLAYEAEECILDMQEFSAQLWTANDAQMARYICLVPSYEEHFLRFWQISDFQSTLVSWSNWNQ